MPIVAWTEDMSVGVPGLDRDHQRLIDLLNRLYAVLRRDDARDEVGAVIAELADYAIRHCAAEEALMERAGYAGLAAHRQSHAMLHQRVADDQADYRRSPRSVVAADLFEFLSDWLIHHILTEDMAYRDAVKTVAPPP